MSKLTKAQEKLDPQGNPVGTKYDIVDCETGKVWKKGVVIKWGSGFKITKEMYEKTTS